MPEKRLTVESRCWLCTFVLGRDYAWYATHIGCVVREYCTRVLISVIAHSTGQVEIHSCSTVHTAQTSINDPSPKQHKQKQKDLKIFPELLCQKCLNLVNIYRILDTLLQPRGKTPCWHLSKMSGRSWIDRVLYTWMHWACHGSHGSTRWLDLSCSNDHEVILQNLAVVCKITISVNPSRNRFAGIFVMFFHILRDKRKFEDKLAHLPLQTHQMLFIVHQLFRSATANNSC